MIVSGETGNNNIIEVAILTETRRYAERRWRDIQVSCFKKCKYSPVTYLISWRETVVFRRRHAS